jgi:hypothetical protein
MDTDKDVLSDDALAEQEKEAVADDSALRTKIVSELGLTDDDTNKELIDKMVKREAGLRGGFGKLLKSHKALKTNKSAPIPPAPKQDEKSELTPEQIREQTRAEVRGELDNEFLEQSDFSDELKSKIKSHAKAEGISARAAAKSDYIVFLKDKEDKQKRADEAADNGTRKGKQGKAVDTSKPLDPKDYDLSTEEGRKAWTDAKKEHAKAREK